uniref:ShKT domain-containing protein n=1 Tax=Periophthalmus magnuspinnatus TaxID=409849 RepID=A0A3B3ZRW0_9GOBI
IFIFCLTCTLLSPDLCTNKTEVQNEIVDLHNQFRRNVQPAAQDMLQMVSPTQDHNTRHSTTTQDTAAHAAPSTRLPEGTLGENMYFSSRSNNWNSIITTWFNEVENFKYPNGSTNGKETRHYTQLIWNTSYKVGCAMAKCNNFRSPLYFYGCRYYRAGNFKNWGPYTEGKPCGMCPNHCVNKLCTNPCPYVDVFTNCRALKNSIGSCNTYVTKNCPALCMCPTQIIPVAR